MTAYFDRVHSELSSLSMRAHAAGKDSYSVVDKARRVVDKMLFDVQLCACLPGFPYDMSDAVQLAIFRDSPEPFDMVEREDVADDLARMFERWQRLTWNLHSVFHELANLGLDRFDDKPDGTLQAHVNALEDKRVELARAKSPEFDEILSRRDETFRDLDEELRRQ